MKKVALAIFLSSFFLLHPFMMAYYGSMYPDDDFDYFAHASSLAFGQFPSYQKEYLMDKTNGPLRAIGPGLLAAPFVFAFSWLDRIHGSDIIEKRTSQNVQTSWAVFGFIFATAFYFCLSCMMLYLATRSIVGPTLAAWALILMIICQGMPLYAYRRPVFSHVPEFFLQSIFVYLLVKNEITSGQLMKKWWAYPLLGAVAGLIILTRYNNILFAIVWPLVFIPQEINQRINWINISRRVLQIYFPMAVLILIFKIWPENYNHYSTYPFKLNEFLTVNAPWQEIARRFWDVLFGLDWGLLFTAPFLLLGIWGLIYLNVPWRWKYLLVSLPILVNFYIINITGYQGSFYGYRYLIASAFPLFVLPLAFLLKWFDRKIGSWWKCGAVILAFFPIMSMWCWEANPSLSTQLIPVFFGKTEWSNATYQISVWKTALDLKALGGIIHSGGIFYWQYLYDAIRSLSGPKVYPPFQLKTLTQVLLIYSLPFVMAWILRDKISKKIK